MASYGNSRDFPAFFVPRSGYQSPYNVQDATKAAELIGNYNSRKCSNFRFILMELFSL